MELQRKEQEMMQMNAKMKTVEEQHADYQKHIAVLKEIRREACDTTMALSQNQQIT